MAKVCRTNISSVVSYGWSDLSAGAEAGWCSCLKHGTTSRNVSSSIPCGVMGFFSLRILNPPYDPGVDSAFDRNGHQDYFLGGKVGRVLGLTTLAPSCADCLENMGSSGSWILNGLSWSVEGYLYFIFRQNRNFCLLSARNANIFFVYSFYVSFGLCGNSYYV